MSLWSRLSFQGETFGLKDVSKKKRKKMKNLAERKKTKVLHHKRRRLGLPKVMSDGQRTQKDFQTMIDSPVLSENTKLFLRKIRGSHGHFGRLTPKQFTVFKKIWWEMKDLEKKNEDVE